MNVSSEDLRNGTVVIWGEKNANEENQEPLGSGFFVGNDGSILTCGHVISGEAFQPGVEIPWRSRTYYAQHDKKEAFQIECVFLSTSFLSLDVAIMRPLNGRLPSGAFVLPIGEYGVSGVSQETDFWLCGANRTETSTGTTKLRLMQKEGSFGIKAPRYVDHPDNEVLQLIPALPLEKGQSGSPILHCSTSRVVGMMTGNFDFDGSYPFATLIESIGEVWQPIRNRLKKQQAYDALTIELREYFSEKPFKRLLEEDVFDEYFQINVQGIMELDSEQRYEALLEQLKRNGKFHVFMDWMSQKYKKSMFRDLITEIPEYSNYHNFVNRKSELRAMSGLSNYLLLDAPAGYGKTALLREVEVLYAEKGWLSVYIEIPENYDNITPQPTGLLGFAERILDVIGVVGLESRSSLEDMGQQIALQLIEREKTFHKEREDESGIILLIDNLDRLTDEQLQSVFRIFIPTIYREIEKEKKSANSDMMFRVRYAGRYMGERLNNLDDIEYLKQPALEEFLPEPIECQPFEYEVICQLVSDRMPQISERYRKQMAAHLLYATGGHPGCLVKINNQIKFTLTPEQQFKTKSREVTFIRENVLKYAHEIRQGIPSKMRPIFDVLSFFRKFNTDILNEILSRKLIDYSGDGYQLRIELLNTSLVHSGNPSGFLQDAVVRRMLALRLRMTDPKRFLELFKHAFEIYQSKLSNPSYGRFLVPEVLFAQLQCEYHHAPISNRGLSVDVLPELNKEERHQLHGEFLGKEGYVNKYLSSITASPHYDSREILDELRKSIIGGGLYKKDWELLFTFNYFMREEFYADTPSNELIRLIDVKHELVM